MLRQKSIAAVVVAALVQVTVFSDPAVAMPAAQKRDEQVRAAIIKMEIGRDTRVSVKLRNGNTVVGYLAAVSDHSFFVTARETNVTTQVPYRNVKQINVFANRAKEALEVVGGITLGIGLWLLYIHFCPDCEI